MRNRMGACKLAATVWPTSTLAGHDNAVDRGADGGVLEVQLGRLQRRFGLLHLGQRAAYLRLSQARLGVADLSCPTAASCCDSACLSCDTANRRPLSGVQFALGNERLTEQLLVTLECAPGIGERDFGPLDIGLSAVDVGLRRFDRRLAVIDVAPGDLHRRRRTGHIGTRLTRPALRRSQDRSGR